MKSIFLAALAAMTLASCAKDEPAATTGNVKEKTNFVVTLPGAPSTYAVEDPQAAGTIAPLYSDVTVYLTYTDGAAVGYAWEAADIQAREKRFEQIIEPAKVIVVANKYGTALPTGATTESAVEAALKFLAIEDQNKIAAATGEISVHQVALYGEQATFKTEAADDDHNLKSAAVELKSLVSRFEAGTVQSDTDADGNKYFTSLEVEAVYLNYFYMDYGMTTAQQFIETSWPASFTPSWATDNGSIDVTSQGGTKAYAYQVFTGDMVPHIIYKVKGELSPGYKLHDGTEGEFTGKYITVKGFKVGAQMLIGNNGDTNDDSDADNYEMKAHEIYKMGLTDDGIKIKPEDVTDEPEKEKIDLIVAITVAPWTVQNVTPEI